MERNDPSSGPKETGLAPSKTKLSLFKAVIESEHAEMELGVKKITAPMERLGTISDWAELNKNKQIISKLFINSNKIVKENKACCARFEEKIRYNSNDKNNLINQIIVVQFEVEDYKNVKNEMEKFVDEYSIYEKFLRDIAQCSTQFNSVGDILNRYETLEHTRKQCSSLLKEGLEEATELRRKMVVLVEKKTNILKKLNNELTMIQVRHKEAREKRLYWEQILNKITKMITLNEENKIGLEGACWDLYRQMCQRRNLIPTAGELDVKAQMNFIQKTFLFYKEVLTVATAVKQNRGSVLKP